MQDRSDFLPYLLVWVILLAIMVARSWRTGASNVGLVLGYGFQMWLLHWLGALAHYFPWSGLPQSDLTYLGFQQSTYGVMAFAIGALVLAPSLSTTHSVKSVVFSDSKLPLTYIIAGIIFYTTLAPALAHVPSLNAITAVGQQLVVTGCCLACWHAWKSGGKKKLVKWLAISFLLPAVTILTRGFAGYGVASLSVILIFVAGFYRPRWVLVLGFAILAYLGLSFFTAYMRDREQIRMAVWGGEAYTGRLKQLHESVRTLEWIDPYNPVHLELIDSRLNQSMLVGAAVIHLSSGDAYAHGETFWDAIVALIPRAIWPNKPIRAGSGGLVTRFTGLTFSEGTSVGIGQVMEFYANFGTLGVIIGFFLLGAALGVIDQKAHRHLISGREQSFALWFLVGIAFFQVGGSLVEISGTAIASLALGSGLKAVLQRADSMAARRRSVDSSQILSVTSRR